MAEKKLPPVPPPTTQIVDERGVMTKEFYAYLLRLVTAIEQENASIRTRKDEGA